SCPDPHIHQGIYLTDYGFRRKAMHYKELFREENEQMIERFTLSIRRIREIREEETVSPVYREYFCEMADYLLKMADLYELIGSGHAKDLSLDEWKTLNHSLYRDIL